MLEIIAFIMFFLFSRLNAMVYRRYSHNITIKNRIVAKIFIAQKNTWDIRTDEDLCNHMSLLGIVSYLLDVLLAFLCFYLDEKDKGLLVLYVVFLLVFFMITVSVKIVEAWKFKRDKYI